MSIIYSNIYDMLLARVYGCYGIPDAEVAGSDDGEIDKVLWTRDTGKWA